MEEQIAIVTYKPIFIDLNSEILRNINGLKLVLIALSIKDIFGSIAEIYLKIAFSQAKLENI
jgi:hypothetical protein